MNPMLQNILLCNPWQYVSVLRRHLCAILGKIHVFKTRIIMLSSPIPDTILYTPAEKSTFVCENGKFI